MNINENLTIKSGMLYKIFTIFPNCDFQKTDVTIRLNAYLARYQNSQTFP